MIISEVRVKVEVKLLFLKNGIIKFKCQIGYKDQI